MIEVVGIKFNNNNKTVYNFLPGNKKLKKGITVIVETEKGLEFGTVELENYNIDKKKDNKPLNEIVRIATKEDFLKNKKNQQIEKKALIYCKELVEKNNLNMTLVDAHYTFDREQLLFRFLSDSRIDFRNLAKELANKYKTRIELRQIGSRDKAKEVGGCGLCGQQLCCSRFLKDLDSVSINMAKNQNIALNPSKINGLCGRLLCCLKYEDENYKCCRKGLPKIGQTVSTEKGEGKVINLDILNKRYSVDVSKIGVIEVQLEDES